MIRLHQSGMSTHCDNWVILQGVANFCGSWSSACSPWIGAETLFLPVLVISGLSGSMLSTKNADDCCIGMQKTLAGCSVSSLTCFDHMHVG